MTRDSTKERPGKAAHQTFEVGVKALIFQDDQLLLLKRRDFPKWEMPGGRINLGETIGQTLLRELGEELPGAWEFTVGDVIHAQQADFVLPSGNRLMQVFLIVDAEPPAIIALSDEHEAFMWLRSPEFADMDLPPQIRAAGTRAFAHHARSDLK